MFNLDNDAQYVVEKTMKLSLERQYTYNITMRYDPRIEVGDIINVDVTIPSTGKTIVKTVIVETIYNRASINNKGDIVAESRLTCREKIF